MSFQVLSERLASLQETNQRLLELIQRVDKFSFQPESIPYNNEDENVITELSTEIQQTIKDQDEDFELLREEASGLESGKPSSELEEQKRGLEEVIRRGTLELRRHQQSFRHAQTKARQNAQNARRHEREILLQSYSNPRPSGTYPILTQRRDNGRASKELIQDEKTINASSDVTLALRRTHNLMASELSRSQFAHDTMKESTAALARVGENHSKLDTYLSSSKQLLTSLVSSQKSDTWYLETTFMLLACVIAWLGFRRFLYGPAWWLVWLPLKLLYSTCAGVFAATGLIGGKNVRISDTLQSSASSLGIISHNDMRPEASLDVLPDVFVNGKMKDARGGAIHTMSEQIGKKIDGDCNKGKKDQNDASEHDLSRSDEADALMDCDEEQSDSESTREENVVESSRKDEL